LTSPQPKYWWGCVPGIPGGVDASGTNKPPAVRNVLHCCDSKSLHFHLIFSVFSFLQSVICLFRLSADTVRSFEFRVRKSWAFRAHSAVRCQSREVGEMMRTYRYRAVGRVSRQPARHDDNYGNRFHPGVQRRLIPRRPFASWSVTERRHPMSLSRRHR